MPLIGFVQSLLSVKGNDDSKNSSWLHHMAEKKNYTQSAATVDGRLWLLLSHRHGSLVKLKIRPGRPIWAFS